LDTLFDVVAIIVLISVPTLLGLIYVELRQRRMFGPRSIISADSSSHDTAAIAMNLQAELERLRADVHGTLTTVSTDIERVRDHVLNREPTGIALGQNSVSQEPNHFDPERAAAVSELYAALSRLDVAFMAVTRPAHLPGEQFDMEGELPVDAYRWESWSDVGTAAYAFAESFSERRIRLDSATREQINATIGSIRRGLTAQLFPVLSESGGYISTEKRETVAHVVGAMASDISDARAILEHISGPAV
jgi:hypothetical protein